MKLTNKNDIYSCNHCGHNWISRGGTPVDCPKCRRRTGVKKYKFKGK